MTYYDEQLSALQEKISRAKQLSAKIEELKHQERALRDEVYQLSAIKFREQADVDRLEGRSLAAFFYNVIGKMDEKLDQERQEAYAARVKCDAAERELAAVEEDLRRYTEEHSSLRSDQKKYDTLLAEKSAAVKAAGGEQAAEILQLEEQSAVLASREKELQEAVYAGHSALNSANEVLRRLDNAEGWSTFDVLGGGLLADLAKHNELDIAQQAVEHLQSDLRRFRTELADVTIHAELEVRVDEFLRFADCFFDNLFTDWTVMEQIQNSIAQVRSTVCDIRNVLARLDSMLRSCKAEQEQCKQRIDTLVREARL